MMADSHTRRGSRISCRNVTRVYRTSSEAVEALIDVNADFRPGELSVIVGPSGSGKSTLLRILAAIDRPTSGSVLIHGRDLAQLGRGARRRIRRLDIGYVHQDPAANLFPYMTIAEHIRFGAQVRGADHLEGVPDLMDRFSLVNLSDRFPAQLSSGQQQLAAMASAVSGSPAVVIADEPTAELDDSSSVAVLDGLRSMRTLGTCVIVATHDQAMLDVADRVLRVRHGRLEGQR